MNFKKSVFSALCAVTLALNTAPAIAAPVYSVAQGDKAILLPPGSPSGSKCTVGFSTQGRSYVSAHCGKDGYGVYLQLPNGYTTGRVGTFHRSPAAVVENGAANFNDWGVIKWDDSVYVGPNRYSGDPLIDPDTVQSGETVCVYGDTTRRINCGPFVGNLGKTFFVDHTQTNPGDSGGPMWVPGRGLVGLISGPDMASMQSWNDSWSVNVTRGAYPGVNDRGHNADQRVSLFSTWVHQGFVPKTTTPQPQPETTSIVPSTEPLPADTPTPVVTETPLTSPTPARPVEPSTFPRETELTTPQSTNETATETPTPAWEPTPLMTFRPGGDNHIRITLEPEAPSNEPAPRLDPVMDEYEFGSILKKKKAKAVTEVEPATPTVSPAAPAAEQPATEQPVAQLAPTHTYVPPTNGRGLTTPAIIGINLGTGGLFGAIWAFLQRIFSR